MFFPLESLTRVQTHTPGIGTLPPNPVVIGYAIEGALLTSARLSTEIALISLALSASFVKFAKRLGNKDMEATRRRSTHLNTERIVRSW